MFTVKSADSSYDDASIEVQVLKTGQRKTLQSVGTYGRYLPSGHFIYMNRATLYAAPMSLDLLELTGPATSVLDKVSMHHTSGCSKISFFSPDGRWLAYDSAGEIEVRPFPGPGGKYPISDNGGRFPIWSPNGRELFYLSASSEGWCVQWETDPPR